VDGPVAGHHDSGERVGFSLAPFLRFADGRRVQIVADAQVDDDLVKQIASAGRQARRGRKPKVESS
jgi:predicted site-specific integrase-resolvase